MKRPSLTALFLAFVVSSGSLALAPVAWSDTPDEQYSQATELYNARLYTTAATELKKFLDANPTNANAKIAAYQWAGAVYRTKNGDAGVDYPAAIKAYEWALQKYPTAPTNVVAAARFELGEAYYLSEQPVQVVKVLTEFLKSPGTDAEAPTRAGWAGYYLGKSYADLKQIAPSRAAFEAVVAKYGASEAAPSALMELGVLDLGEGKNATAITRFTSLRAKFPNADDAPEAQVRLGEAQLGAKNYDAARQSLRAALADPKAADFKTDVLQDLADADFAQKKWDDAAQSYATLLEALPAKDARRVSAQSQRAGAFFNAKKWDEALASYAPLLNGDAPVKAPALYYSAGSLSEQGKFAESAAMYRQFLTAFPNHALASKAALRLGDALSDAKEPAQAAQAYKVVLTRFPGTDAARSAQSALTDLAGTSGAEGAVEDALRGLPPSAASNAQLRLAQAAFERGDFAKSAQLASTVASAKGDAVTTENALYLVGSARLNAKNAPAAATAFQSQLTAFPKGKLAGQGRLGLAWAFEDQKKWSETEVAARAALLAGADKDRTNLTLGRALLNQKKFAPASLAFGAVAGSTDKVAAAQGAQGAALAFEKQNLWRDAAAQWGKRAGLVADGEPKAQALLRQGLALVKAKDNTGALAAFDAAATAAPKTEVGAQAIYESAWAAHDAKQSAIEGARWARLETDFPDSKLAPEAAFQSGETAQDAKKWDDAAAAYERLLQKYPTSDLAPQAQFRLGTALYNAQKWPAAAAAFDKVGTTKESFGLEAPYWAAESLRKSGDAAASATRYSRFVTGVEASPTAPADLKALVPAARLGWGQSLSDPAQAEKVYQPALAAARGATKTELEFRLGAAQATQNKWTTALPHLLPVATAEGQFQSQAQWLTAQALENTGAKADALAMYQKLAATTPANEWSEKAAARVKELS